MDMHQTMWALHLWLGYNIGRPKPYVLLSIHA
jgi:hypothetical protein